MARCVFASCHPLVFVFEVIFNPSLMRSHAFQLQIRFRCYYGPALFLTACVLLSAQGCRGLWGESWVPLGARCPFRVKGCWVVRVACLGWPGGAIGGCIRPAGSGAACVGRGLPRPMLEAFGRAVERAKQERKRHPAHAAHHHTRNAPAPYSRRRPNSSFGPDSKPCFGKKNAIIAVGGWQAMSARATYGWWFEALDVGAFDIIGT